jgi:hypothetical protein
MLAELLVSFAAEDQAPDLETARALRRQQLLLS